jgi:hypothetical protein
MSLRTLDDLDKLAIAELARHRRSLEDQMAERKPGKADATFRERRLLR